METMIKTEYMGIREPLDADVDAMLKESFLSDDEVLGLGLQLVKMEDESHHDENDDDDLLDLDAAQMMDLELPPLMDSTTSFVDQIDFSPANERRIGEKNKRRSNSFSHEDSVAYTAAPLPPASVSRTTTTKGGVNRSLLQDQVHAIVKQEPDTEEQQPPRAALTSDLNALSNPSSRQNEFMRVTSQPPLEVRTRTKNENRTFGCEVQVLRIPDPANAKASVELCYATDTSVIISTMGGTLTRPVAKGRVTFDDLSVSVASPKHAEKEFVLKVTLAGAPDHPVYSTPFYAYSHKSVLKRRREVSLRAASHNVVSARGGEDMHVVGLPFVRSDRLQVVFRVHKRHCSDCLESVQAESSMHGATNPNEDWFSIRATDLEFFSESVLFFRTPTVFANTTQDVPCSLQVTNDGRNFSASIPVVFNADAPPSPKRHCAAIRSRM